MKKISLAFVSLALLLAACSSPEALVEEPTTPTDQPASKLMMHGEHAIAVMPQPAGADEVIVTMAVMGQAGFVVIHEDANGRPGATIANSELLENGGSRVSVDMPKELKDGETYFAMLHGDNGDGEFNEADDAALIDADGNDVTMHFEVTDDVDEVADIAI